MPSFTEQGEGASITFQANAQGGSPCMRYPGSKSLVSTSTTNLASLGYTNTWTTVTAAKNNRGNTFSFPLYFYQIRDNSDSTTQFFDWWAPFYDGNRYIDYGSPAGNWRITNANTLNNNAAIYSAYSNGTTGTGLVNGSSVLTGAMNKTIGSVSTHSFLIGGFQNNSARYIESSVGDFYAFATGPFHNPSLETRIRHSMAFSFKIACS
jgi:hypothetical protein